MARAALNSEGEDNLKRPALRVLAVLSALAFAVAFAASLTSAASNDAGEKPESVESKTDAAVAKLDDALQQKLEDGATASVPVFLVATDANAAAVEALLTDAHAASRNGRSIVVGRIAVQKLPKLASFDSVRSVGSITFTPTNMPSTENTVRPARRPAQGAERGAAGVLQARGAVRAGSAAARVAFRGAEEAQRPRREDAQVRRRVEAPASPARASTVSRPRRPAPTGATPISSARGRRGAPTRRIPAGSVGRRRSTPTTRSSSSRRPTSSTRA
jgi:hypothetical protein